MRFSFLESKKRSDVMRYERILFEELSCTLLQHFAYHKVSVGWGSFSYIFPFLFSFFFFSDTICLASFAVSQHSHFVFLCMLE